MNNLKIYVLLILGVFVSSCISTRDLIYLQEGKSASNEVVTPLNQNPYRLQANDIITVSIKAIDPKLVEIFNPSLTAQNGGMLNEQSAYYTGYSIDDHGNIRMPILGEINVLGYTVDDVRIQIEKLLLNKFFKSEAGIYVVVKLSGFRYTINGEVTTTGTKTLFQDKVNIMEAIANSGDITTTGDRKAVKVIRRFPSGNQTYTIDLTDANAVNSPCYYLQPNDYILVNPLRQKTWGTGKTGLESLTTIITILTLATTTFLLLRN